MHAESAHQSPAEWRRDQRPRRRGGQRRDFGDCNVEEEEGTAQKQRRRQKQAPVSGGHRTVHAESLKVKWFKRSRRSPAERTKSEQAKAMKRADSVTTRVDLKLA